MKGLTTSPDPHFPSSASRLRLCRRGNIVNGFMIGFVNKLVVVLACLSAAFAPMFTDMVLCAGDNGHVAVERAHDATGCPESTDASTEHKSDSEPCSDTPIPPDNLTVQDAKTRASEMDRVLAPTVLFASLVALNMSDTNHLVRQPSILDSPPAALRGAALGVRTTVLLI